MNMTMSSVFLSESKHLWDVIEQEIRSMNVQLTNLQKLCDARNVSNFLWNPYHEELKLF